MVATLPATGKGNWTDFEDYWRDADVSWLQDRLILRYATDAERDGDLGGSPANGQVVYNSTLGLLQLRHANAWKNYNVLPSNLVVTLDTSAGAGLAHVGAGNKGIVFGPLGVAINHDLGVLGGVLSVSAAGVGVKTGTKSAVFSTNATHLVSDTPIQAPGINLLFGTGVVLNANTAGTSALFNAVTAASLTATGTVTAGVLSASSATIAGSILANNEIVTPTNKGMRSGQGWFYGFSTGAVMRQTTDGVTGSNNWITVDTDSVNVAGVTGTFNVHPLMRVYEGKPIQWYDANNSFRGNIAPVIYQPSGTPDAHLYPEGTIWIS